MALHEMEKVLLHGSLPYEERMPMDLELGVIA